MILKDILSISGEPGLFRFIAQGKSAIIVEHIMTGKRSSAFSSAKVSSLEDISIFTDNEDLPLGKVFDRIFENETGGPAPDFKSDGKKLKEYFELVVPDYSKDKVYVSDIKKVVQWYNILQGKNLLVKEEPVTEDQTENESSEEEQKVAEVKPKKKAAPKSGKE